MAGIFTVNKTISGSKMPVLPKNTPIKEKYEGSIRVIEAFNQKSEVNQSDWQDELAPDRPFVETINAINQDPRLNLSNETYIQMVLGKGLRVTAKKESVADMVTEWFDEINWDEQLEDALYSYLGCGNMFFEHDPTYGEYVEVPVTTIQSIVRDKKGNVKYYLQHVNEQDIKLRPTEVTQFKLTNVSREAFGRGLHHSVLSTYTNPDTGEVFDSPLIQMKKMEDAMPKIFEGHADPTVMFHFADAGEQFIKTQADALKKMKHGSKIVTDKEFDVKVIESSGNSKFEGYIDHIQKDLLEPGSKFPLQFFNAGFTARAASESTDSVLTRKVKRIQSRLANQIKMKMVIPYLKRHGKSVKSKDIQIFFETPQKQEATIADVTTSFRDNLIKRSEARKWFIANSSIDINENDMKDEAPITSVTPTNQLQDTRDEPENTSIKDNDTNEKLLEMVNLREELDRAEKRKNTEEILNFIRGLKND
jgi:hypothetical protein